jgi:hypothetical protein
VPDDGGDGEDREDRSQPHPFDSEGRAGKQTAGRLDTGGRRLAVEILFDFTREREG